MKRHTYCMIIALPLLAGGLAGCNAFLEDPSDGGTGDFLASGRTGSFFEAVQVDPRAEDSAGPQFADHGDFDGDGRIDIATAWNQSQPIQIHVQVQDSSGKLQFATLPLGGTTPIAQVSGLIVEDMDLDGFDDVVVLVKDTGLVVRCDQSRDDCDVTENGGIIDNAIQGMIVIFFNPGGSVFDTPWDAVLLEQSRLAGTDERSLPEVGGYADMDIGDIDGVNGPDIVVTLNSPEGEAAEDERINTVDFYPNPGGAIARTADAWARSKVFGDLPRIGSCRISDVDDDGDNDIIITVPNARTANVRWLANPLSFGANGNVYDWWPPYSPIGQIATGADVLEIGDVDGDGNDDVMVRSTVGQIIQWFKRPSQPSPIFIRSPWQVYTVAEFSGRSPGAIALGDVTGDGRLDAAIAAQGAVAWFTAFDSSSSSITSSSSVFDLWQETMIIDDSPTAVAGTAPVAAATSNGLGTFVTDPNAGAMAVSSGTLVNAIFIADVDGDGFNDIVATLDRSALSGLSNDALVLLRNIRGDSN